MAQSITVNTSGLGDSESAQRSEIKYSNRNAQCDETDVRRHKAIYVNILKVTPKRIMAFDWKAFLN